MIFFKVDVTVRSHPRFLKAGREAKGMWVDLMSYTREHELDGRIPKIALSTFEGTMREKLRLVGLLVREGLVVDEGDDFVLHNYAEKGNQTKADVDAAKKENRDRQARYRESRNALLTGGRNALLTPPTGALVPSSSSNSNSSLSRSEGDPRGPDANPDWGLESERTSGVSRVASVGIDAIPANPPAGVTERHLEYQRAYESGVAAGKGAPYAMPEAQRADLHRIIAVFGKNREGKPYRGDHLDAWITHTAKEFATQVRGREAQFYSAFGPRGCLKFLNEAEVTEAGNG